MPAGTIKAGLVTSLGFGHVSALMLILHPAAFEAALDAKALGEWRVAVSERAERARREREAVLTGAAKAFVKRTDRRFHAEDNSDAQADEEAAMLLDPNARLGTQERFEGDRT